MNDGRLLITGDVKQRDQFIAEAGICDAPTDEFAITASLSSARAYNTSTLLQNGKVLIVDGPSNQFEILSSAELLDPTTDTFRDTSTMSVSGTRFASAWALSRQAR